MEGQPGDQAPPFASCHGRTIDRTADKPGIELGPCAGGHKKEDQNAHDQHRRRGLRLGFIPGLNRRPILVFLHIAAQMLRRGLKVFFRHPESAGRFFLAVFNVRRLQDKGQGFQRRDLVVGQQTGVGEGGRLVVHMATGTTGTGARPDSLDNWGKILTLDKIVIFPNHEKSAAPDPIVPEPPYRQCSHRNPKMLTLFKRCAPFLAVFLALVLIDTAIVPESADARSKSGGRMFSNPSSRPAPQSTPNKQFNQQQQNQQPGGFSRGLMGGLLGGALGGMLFGSLFGGSGMGILPLIILGAVGYFLYKRFVNRPRSSSSSGYQPPPSSMFRGDNGMYGGGSVPPVPPVPPVSEAMSVEQGLREIRRNDPGFDEKYFLEIASDAFFKVQAGWMRRELDTFRHLLGNQLASEYEQHFEEMKAQGRINKLESIAIRRVEISAAGSENGEDFITVLFTANLLDYTVDDQSGALLEGSMTEPVKFAENWTWARPVRTENWRLEGIEVVDED